jgi:hypothetical protein
MDFKFNEPNMAGQRLADLEPIALIFAADDAFQRPTAAVFVAPDDERLVHIPVTGTNDLAWPKARYIVDPNADLKMPPATGVNFQPDSKIPALGECAEPQLNSWLRLVATSWSRPQAAKQHTPFNRDPA